MTQCCSFSRWTESFIDGELSPEHTIDFENHFPTCELCHTKLKFERAYRISAQRAVRSVAQPSAAFEARLRAALAQERATQEQESQSAAVTTPIPLAPVVPISATHVPHRPLSWRSIAPLSVAAAAALAFAALRGEPAPSGYAGMTPHGSEQNRSDRTDTMQKVREFLDQLASDGEHTPSEPHFPMPRLFPVEAETVVGGRRFTPPRLEPAIWEGYHVQQVPVQGRVSSWHYRVGKHRVLLWVYDSQKLPLRAVLEPQVARNQAVFVGTHHGRAVAALERNGVGYAATTTSLPPTETAELVASVGNAIIR
ncbi:MAG: hypothetical protein QM784_13660 [Polyangiaceae bacterium]